MASARAALGLAGALLAAGLGGCMFLVDSELGTIHCADEGALGPPACPSGQACVSGTCAPGLPPGPALGRRCSSDLDCATGDFCLEPSLFGTSTPKTCTRPCCVSSDCNLESDAGAGDELVCWVPPRGGGALCRRANELKRESPGTGHAGEACVSGVDCRSGKCDKLHCIDTCCSDAQCSAGDGRCHAVDQGVSEGAAWSCAPAGPTGLGYLEPCAKDAECASGLCLLVADKLVCSQPCCDSGSCGVYNQGAVAGNLACAQVPHHGSLLRACAALLPTTATGATGASCASDLDCRSGTCVADRCSDVCCVDADCGDPAATACRPYDAGDAWALRCTPL